MLAYLWIAIGGALGSVGRFWLSGLVAGRYGETFPWGTLLVNVSGSFSSGSSPRSIVRKGACSRLVASATSLFMARAAATIRSHRSVGKRSTRAGGEWLRAGGNVLAQSPCLIAVWLGLLPRALIP